MAGREGFEPSRDIAAPTHLAGGRTRPGYATSPYPGTSADPGGGRGIRTPGDITATVVFKTTAFVLSAIPPGQDLPAINRHSINLSREGLSNKTVHVHYKKETAVD